MIHTQFLGHASLRFAGATGALVCDPWFSTIPIYGNTAVKYPFVPRELLPTALVATHLYISHHHEDHFHVPTLDLYPRDVTVLIPAFEYATHPRGASMRRTLERLGFSNIVCLKSWESIDIDLGESVSLTLIPSAKSRWHDWENSGLILRTADWTAINLNDNLVDAELLGEIWSRCGRPDAAFVQGFPSTEFPGSFDFSVRDKIRIGRQKRGNVEQADLVIRALEPRIVTPIACDIAWHRAQDLYRNYSDKPTPSRFGRILQDRGLLAKTRYLELGPADSLDIARQSVERPYGCLNYAGFRRRLKEKMPKFAGLVDRYDSFDPRRVFDPASERRLVDDLRRYFPSTFPIEASVRIDFVVQDRGGGCLTRISFCVRGRSVSISADADTGMECDQEIIVPLAIWLECQGGRLLRRDLVAMCVNRQLKPFQFAIAGLRYFISYYFDFGDISPWLGISAQNGPRDSGPRDNLAQMRALRADLSPQFDAGHLRDEYQRRA